MKQLGAKIVFFGSSYRAVIVLDALEKSALSPAVVVTSNSAETREWLAEREKGIKVLRPKKIDKEAIAALRAEEPNIGVLASYGKILPKELIDIFPRGILNVHPSLLPKYRGPSPEQAAILSGDKTTGVTILLTAEKMDAGPILTQEEVSVSGNDTLRSLSEKLFLKGAELLVKTLPSWLSGVVTAKEQEHSRATYTKLLKKEGGLIDWSRDAEEIERMVRAYHPWPGTFTKFSISNSQFSILKIKRVEIVEKFPSLSRRSVGEVFAIDSFPTVACGSGALKLLVVQPEGKKDMPGDAFLRGYPQFVGTML